MTHDEVLTAIAELFADMNWIIQFEDNEMYLSKKEPYIDEDLSLWTTEDWVNKFERLPSSLLSYHDETNWRNTLRNLNNYRE